MGTIRQHRSTSGQSIGWPAPAAAVVIGASGGIGGALVRGLLEACDFATVLALSRAGIQPVLDHPRLAHGAIDLLDEASIAAAVHGPLADALGSTGASLRLVLVATGALQGEGIAAPERSYRALDPDSLLRATRINMVGPALVAKHMLPLLPRTGRSVFAALSARVGSIGDNRLGGWHAYRAAKASLNMMLRNFAIEIGRTHPEAVVLGLHPGTVATALSKPFQGGVANDKLFTAAFSAARLLSVIASATPAQSGQVLAWDGAVVPP